MFKTQFIVVPFILTAAAPVETRTRTPGLSGFPPLQKNDLLTK